MSQSPGSRRLALLLLGVLAGATIVLVWPKSRMEASATDRNENFAICTGALDEEIEGLFFLDFVTGELKCTVLNIQTGKFGGLFSRSVFGDFGIEPGKNPKFLMVTGLAYLRRTGGNIRPSAAVLYVVEATSGRVAAYSVPWAGRNINTAQLGATLTLLDLGATRPDVVREN